MKTTIDLPEDLLRRAKSEAALRGRKLREMVIEGIVRVLNEPEPAAPARRASLHDQLGQYCGIVKSGVGDLSTNPKHLEGLGEE